MNRQGDTAIWAKKTNAHVHMHQLRGVAAARGQDQQVERHLSALGAGHRRPHAAHAVLDEVVAQGEDVRGLPREANDDKGMRRSGEGRSSAI